MTEQNNKQAYQVHVNCQPHDGNYKSVGWPSLPHYNALELHCFECLKNSRCPSAPPPHYSSNRRVVLYCLRMRIKKILCRSFGNINLGMRRNDCLRFIPPRHVGQLHSHCDGGGHYNLFLRFIRNNRQITISLVVKTKSQNTPTTASKTEQRRRRLKLLPFVPSKGINQQVFDFYNICIHLTLQRDSIPAD